MTGVPSHDAPVPRAGSLEWLADQQGDALAILDAADGRRVSRAEHDAGADALARGLAAEHDIAPQVRVAVALSSGPGLLTVLYALAKLGAAPVLLAGVAPVGAILASARTAGCSLLISDGVLHEAGPDGPKLLPAPALAALRERHAEGPRRLSGDQPPADSVQCTLTHPPRLVLRTRTPERIARLAATVGDLLARVALEPGGVHVLGPAAHDPETQFWAGVTLVTGGSVVTVASPEPQAMLHALAEHAATSVVLDAAQLRALTSLPAQLTDAADLTTLQRVIACGGCLDAPLVAACADLFGEDVLQAVKATTQTGPFAHADTAALQDDPSSAGRPLAGVQVSVADDDELLVRSPLAADGALGDAVARGGWPSAPAWQDAPVPTGDLGAVTDDGRVIVLGPAPPARP
jgi:acyl-coenzyme A synthetase/AMP-(fatty) acid ligase